MYTPVVHQLGIRDLRAHVATAVRRAGAGERIVVTVGGRPVAQLGPIEPIGEDLTIDDLAARGLVVAPRRTDPLPPGATVTAPLPVGARLDRVLTEVRGR